MILDKNPLSPTPPLPSGRTHRLGEAHIQPIRDLFGDLDEGFDDIHRGVFLTDLPIVAYAYAEDRRETGENAFGLPDVVNPPVLIGLRIPEEDEHIDTDAMVTAMNLLDVAQQLRLDDHAFYEELEQVEDLIRDHSRSEYYSLTDESLSSIGGDYGNRPNPYEFYEAVKQIAEALDQADISAAEELVDLPENIRELALKKAAELIPQSRLLREVHEDEVARIVVVPPFPTMANIFGEESEFPTRDPGLDDPGVPADEIGQVSNWLLDEGTIIYESGKKPNRWHGTSLGIARRAFPRIVTFEVVNNGVRAGSAYDLDALEAEYEDEDEDEDGEYVDTTGEAVVDED